MKQKNWVTKGKLRKLISIVLVLAMMLTCFTFDVSAGKNGTITVNTYSHNSDGSITISFSVTGGLSLKYAVGDGNESAIINNMLTIDSGIVQADSEVTIKVSGYKKGTCEDSKEIQLSKPSTPTDINSTACTTIAQNDGTITGVDNTMEYCLSSNNESWTACEGDTVTGLSNGTYYVRVKGSGTQFASDCTQVTVAEYTPTNEETPQATFTATGYDTGTLSNVSDGMKYSTDGSAWSDINAATVELTSLNVCTISVVKKSNGTTTVDSIAKTIDVTRAATPELTPTQPSDTVAKGTIPTTSVHQYSTNATEWTDCSGGMDNLEPGTYYVRVKAKDQTLASDYQTIVINQYVSNQVATPEVSVNPGIYTSAQTVTLSCDTEGASIYYTLDGDDPTNASTPYTSGISINATTTLKAIAVKDGMVDSEILTAEYTITGTVAAPTASPEAGTYSGQVKVTLTTTTDGADIYYTTDGTLPTNNSTKYTEPVTINSDTTLKAIAVKADWDNSETFEANYSIMPQGVYYADDGVTEIEYLSNNSKVKLVGVWEYDDKIYLALVKNATNGNFDNKEVTSFSIGDVPGDISTGAQHYKTSVQVKSKTDSSLLKQYDNEHIWICSAEGALGEKTPVSVTIGEWNINTDLHALNEWKYGLSEDKSSVVASQWIIKDKKYVEDTEKIELTKPASTAYDGKEKPATCSFYDNGTAKENSNAFSSDLIGDGAINYYKETELLSEAPKEPGTYTAKTAAKVGEETYVAELEYTIVKGTLEYTKPKGFSGNNSLEYNSEQAQQLVTAGSVAEGTGTIEYSVSKTASENPPTDWNAEIPTAKDIGTYYVWYKITAADQDHYNDVEPTCVTTTIGKTHINPAVTMDNYTYGGDLSTPSLTEESNPGGGTVTYYYNKSESNINGTKWVDMTSTKLDAGSYYIYAVVGESDSYQGKTTEPVKFTVKKETPALTAPTAYNGTGSLTYSGAAQNLANGGSVTNGTLKYALSDKSNTSNNIKDWYDAIPTGKDAGTYYVWYKVVGASNYENIAPSCLTTVINKASLTITSAAISDKTYNKNKNADVTAVEFSGLKNSETLTLGNDYSVSAEYDKAGASGSDAATQVTVTVELKNSSAVAKNYSIAGPYVINGKTIGKVKVAVPEAVSGLVYNETELTGVVLPENALYTLTDNKGIDVGNYTAVAELKDKDNYEWNLDTPTSENQNIPWSISKGDRLAVTIDGTTKYYKSGSKINRPDNPVQAGYIFGGWCSDQALTHEWDFEKDTVTTDMTLYKKWIPIDSKRAQLYGLVTQNNDNQKVSGAVVKLMLGTTLIAKTITDASGNYSFANIENGKYNVVVTNGEQTKTALISVKSSGTHEIDTIKMGNKEISSKVEFVSNTETDSKSDVSQITVGGIDEIAEANSSGQKPVVVTFKAAAMAEDSNDPAQNAIKVLAAGKTVEFIDFSLVKTQTGADSNITDTNGKLVTINLPFDTSGIDADSIEIYRYHKDKAEKFTRIADEAKIADLTFMVNDGYLTIYSDKFSEYGIGYTLVKEKKSLLKWIVAGTAAIVGLNVVTVALLANSGSVLSGSSLFNNMSALTSSFSTLRSYLLDLLWLN